MQTKATHAKRPIQVNADIDQLESMGTKIQWNDNENSEAGTVLLAAETDGPPIHFHPAQEEVFYIRKGELMVFKKNKWIRLIEGQSLHIPKRTPHTYKNVSKDEAIFDFMLTPRTRFRKMLEEMDTYVQDQKIKGTDFRSILYLCRVMNKYPDVTISVKPPQFVVRAMAWLSTFLVK